MNSSNHCAAKRSCGAVSGPFGISRMPGSRTLAIRMKGTEERMGAAGRYGRLLPGSLITYHLQMR
jgi:hypothetical protein